MIFLLNSSRRDAETQRSQREEERRDMKDKPLYSLISFASFAPLRLYVKKLGISLLFLLGGAGVFAQDRQNGAYMIPTKVFVGDRASLILPLPNFSGQPVEETSPAQIPSSAVIDIHRIALERRPGGNRLAIEFSAYAPGILELPPITIGTETFTGLRVEISSILSPGDSGKVLSGAELPLAIPGTSLLVYGTISITILLLLLALWALFWGRRQMKGWLEAWKHRRLLGLMWRIVRRLRREMARGSERRKILDTLSVEFRSFLSYFSGNSCRAMTASEFGSLAFFEKYPEVPGGDFLGDFFSRCDRIRFSGMNISSVETLVLFGEIRLFLKMLERAVRKKPGRRERQ